jgi:hypothetical protein
MMMMGIPMIGALWLVVAPFVLAFGGTAQWSNVAVGILGAVFALWSEAPYRPYVFMALGAYVVVASLVLWPLSGIAMMLNIVAAVALGAGGYFAMQGEKSIGRAAA